MIFHEIYGSYYAAVTEIIRAALGGSLTRDLMLRIIRETAFQESVIAIPEALESGRWPFLGPGCVSRIRHAPARPLTSLEKQWLKALLADPRIKLFDVDESGLEDVPALFEPADFVYFDRNSDGDPFDDPGYIGIFRMVLRAVKEKKWLSLRFLPGEEAPCGPGVFPKALEYSARDDHFRLRVRTEDGRDTAVNAAAIAECRVLENLPPPADTGVISPTRELVLMIRDERNTPERVLLHFSHFKKRTERTGDGLYRMTLEYEEEDEEEMILRVLSFGPTVRVVSPQRIRDALIEKIKHQLRA